MQSFVFASFIQHSFLPVSFIIKFEKRFLLSLKNEIHQHRRFRNEHHKALVNLIFSYGWVKDQLQQIFEKENLSLQQYNILRILNGSKHPLSTLKIRERMLDKMSDTSRIVDRLIAKNLVVKKMNRIDKRLVDVSISAKGKKLIKKMEIFNADIDNILKNISTAEAVIFNTLLDKIRQP